MSVAMPPADPVVLAHAVSVRSDLPVPLLAVLVAGAAAVVVSFVALGALWRTSRLRGDEAGRVLPTSAQRLLDSRLLRGVLRAVVLVVTLFVLVVALLGPRESAFNLAPYAFYVTFWVGLVPASLLLGPVWRAVNPLRTLHAGLAYLSGPAPGAAVLPRLGLWPATAFLLAYAWVELVLPDRAVPRTLGVLLVAYIGVQLLAALWYGPQWFAAGDAFEAYSTLLGRLSPLGRRADGRWVLRNPLDGVDATPRVPGLAAFVTALVATTAFDGLGRTTYYQDNYVLNGDEIGVPTLGLALTVLLVGGLYAGAAALATRAARGDSADDSSGAALFAHSLVPIAAGYAVAHYFSLLFFEGQLTWILASNPFGVDGVDLFGTYRNTVDLTVLSPRTIAGVQVGAVIGGHVLAVVLAHDRAVRVAGLHRTARTAQYPLLALMVGLTLLALRLLLG
jgi:hypothetical protein